MSIRPVSKNSRARRKRAKRTPRGSLGRPGGTTRNRPKPDSHLQEQKIDEGIDTVLEPGAGIACLGGLGPDAETKKRPGPKPIPDAMLVAHAEELQGMLGSAWPEIGWQLKHINAPDGLRAALEPLKDSVQVGFPAVFFRPTEDKATARTLYSTRKAIAQVLTNQTTARERLKKLMEESRTADAALAQTTEERERTRTVTSALRAEYEKKKISLKAPDLRKRLRAADTVLAEAIEQHDRIKTSADRRHAMVEEEKIALDEINEELNSLETKKRDQEAYYCRHELFNFVRSRRYACTPRNLAMAIAGLPIVGCSWSAARCVKYMYDRTEHEAYRLVEFLRRIWEAIALSEQEQKMCLLERSIAEKVRALPKDDCLRAKLAENWRDLKRAIRTGIEEGQTSDIHHQRVPYLIASNFYKNVSQPKTPVELLLAEQEQLNLE